MIHRLLLTFLVMGLPLLAQATRVAITTEFGTLDIDLEPTKAPLTTLNFLRHVDAGTYTNGQFHRSVTLENQPSNKVKIQVIQGGAEREEGKASPVRLERTRDTGLRHVDGTISMARDTPDSATSDFFICIGDQPELDFGGRRNSDGQGFAAFGRVVKGMDVVRRIQRSPAKGQTLTPAVKILSVRRLPNP